MVRKKGLGDDPSQVLTDRWGDLLEEMIRDQLQGPKGPRSPSVTDRRQNRWDQLVHVPGATVDLDGWFDRLSCLLKLEGTLKCQTQPDSSPPDAQRGLYFQDFTGLNHCRDI